jgi:hypothetical protein
LADPEVVEMSALGKKWIQNTEGEAATFPSVPERQVAGCPCPRCQNE